MIPNAAPATPGCGCGGSGTVTAAPAATAFARPRFFAGQLLTEDDLGALTAYVTAKDRLHNRYLFGAGVVCGLWVSCDPCGGGTVTVQPGYALDCCGNDLVLACPAPLDVNAMIRDLRAARLGKDCGDPCAEQGTQPAGGTTTADTRHYLLYARYGEQVTDPVAPYATGEPCGQVACEPTRIREGISFVLKCPADTPPPGDLGSRLRACLPSQEILRQVALLRAYSGPMVAAVGAPGNPPAFRTEDAGKLATLRTELAEARKEAGEQQVRSATEYVRKLAAVIAGYDLAKDRTEYADMSNARSELRNAAAALSGAALSGAAAGYDPMDRPAVDALLSQAQLADPAAALSEVQLAMLAQGRPLDESVLAALASAAAAVREWMLNRLDSDPALADCELRSQVQAVPVPKATTQETADISSLGSAGSALVGLFTRLMTDGICAALNPPCAPCDDTDVLLAGIEVCDCEVQRICNAKRDYVISGTALRYWLQTTQAHQEFEAICCPAETELAARAQPGRLVFAETGFVAGEPEAGMPWDLLGLPDVASLLRTRLTGGEQ